jgi:glycine betaine/choline ABC-type transport system substrate-binding protein
MGSWIRRLTSLGSGLLVATVLLAAAGPAAAQKPRIVIGSKNYTESFLAAHLMAELLESAGYPVERKVGLGGTAVIHQALVSGDIDVYAEYTGTALLVMLKMPVTSDPDQAYATVRDEYAKRWQLTWLKPFGFNDTYALAMRRERATQLGATKISELRGKAGDLVLGATQEFTVRADGLPGLQQKYGLRFKEAKGMDPGLVYKALEAGQVDIISVFSTDGRIGAMNLVVLQDDQRYFPPYYLTPVVRKALLDKAPEVADVLNRLAGRIDEATMIRLNLDVDQNKREPQQVAREFLVRLGLVK